MQSEGSLLTQGALGRTKSKPLHGKCTEGNDQVMTIEPSSSDGKTRKGSRKDSFRDTSSQGVITERAAVIFTVALVIGIAAGALGYLAGGNPAAAVLTGGAAFGGAVALLLRLLG